MGLQELKSEMSKAKLLTDENWTGFPLKELVGKKRQK